MKKEQRDLFGNVVTDPKRTMSDYFGVAPFSVLNSVDGEWQKRKQRWNVLINDKGQAREGVLGGSTSKKDVMNKMKGSSILDAVLAELMIKWFTEKGFKTLVLGCDLGSFRLPFVLKNLTASRTSFSVSSESDFLYLYGRLSAIMPPIVVAGIIVRYILY